MIPIPVRFVQEDPIGLAGGMDLYGFASGDPINFSDPFGLSPPKDADPCNVEAGDPNLDELSSRQPLETLHPSTRKTIRSWFAVDYWLHAGECHILTAEGMPYLNGGGYDE